MPPAVGNNQPRQACHVVSQPGGGAVSLVQVQGTAQSTKREMAAGQVRCTISCPKLVRVAMVDLVCGALLHDGSNSGQGPFSTLCKVGSSLDSGLPMLQGSHAPQIYTTYSMAHGTDAGCYHADGQ